MKKFWLETNSYFGWVFINENDLDIKRNNISFREAKDILLKEQQTNIFDCKSVIDMEENEYCNFGLKIEHLNGITLRDYCIKNNILLEGLYDV